MSRPALALIATVWLALTSAGFGLLARHDFEAGPAGTTPRMWPVSSRLKHSSQLPTLLLFLHPHCPCSRASLRQLKSLESRRPGQLRIIVALVEPGCTPPDWSEGEIGRMAQRMGYDVLEDLEACLATEFGALTSGYALLYSTDGSLRFSGGLTDSRGHEGDSFAMLQLEQALNRQGLFQEGPLASKVYGCLVRKGETNCR